MILLTMKHLKGITQCRYPLTWLSIFHPARMPMQEPLQLQHIASEAPIHSILIALKTQRAQAQFLWESQIP